MSFLSFPFLSTSYSTSHSLSLSFCLPALFTLGNIKAKWPSVCRRGIDSANRVVQLFTGYKGPRFCVEVLTHACTYSPTRPFSLFEYCPTIYYFHALFSLNNILGAVYPRPLILLYTPSCYLLHHIPFPSRDSLGARIIYLNYFKHFDCT